ncbi:deoxyribodipyrimidine photo-lyase, partial [Endozoicomonas sp.]|nr:deoxyribodipyrimidine photo-lyase [Endozoicomonas sp.]
MRKFYLYWRSDIKEQSMSERRELVWLRTDLRVSDNKALYYASHSGAVMGVFLLFPEQWRQHNDSPNKLWFLLENLRALKKQLNDLNIPLVTVTLSRYDEAAKTLAGLAKKHACSGIWFNDEYGVNEQNRDDHVESSCLQQSINCQRFTDQLLSKPGTVLNGKGEYFKVFTPFKKSLYQRLIHDDIKPLPKPKKQALSDFQAINGVMPTNNYKPTAQDASQQWPAGEACAQKRLALFISDGLDQYNDQRDYPAISGTSSLSPWLTVGAISIRQCFYSAWVANQGELDTGSEGAVCWLSELIWREFYRHVLVGFPRVSKGRAFNEVTDRLPWSYDGQRLMAWQQGKTGFPIVDAAMRQLVATGWMHNRLRMVSAMFLSKNLMLDWRLG